jgi:hypothetical protein
MSDGSVIKVRLTLKGRPLKSYTFAKDVVSIGRDPESDIFLDNTGVSRRHARIVCAEGGVYVEDLGSANGTYLNQKKVQKGYVHSDEPVIISKFSLWITRETPQGAPGAAGRSVAPEAMEGTTVLSTDQLARMMRTETVQQPINPALELVREAEAPKPEQPPEPVAPQPQAKLPGMPNRPVGIVVLAAALAFLIGAIIGAGFVLLSLDRLGVTGIFQR